jgi:predicted RNase H-like HicB family nuclease
MRWPIVIHKDEGSDYGVSVPDLPGCFSAGSTLDAALDGAREAIGCHMEGLLLDGEAIPEPRSLEAHRADPDWADGIWAIVEVDLSRLDDKAERINITLPRRVLTLIDHYAAAHHETRSGFLARAALAEIKRD